LYQRVVGDPLGIVSSSSSPSVPIGGAKTTPPFENFFTYKIKNGNNL
jgi:hypothetical protein